MAPTRTAERIAAGLGLQADSTSSLSAADQGGAEEGGSSYAALLSPQNRRNTLFLWAVFFIVMFAFYFANTWTPQLLTEVGFTPRRGSWAA
ncbi:hypothetical protein [Nesterenkonia pannonica]|uniref:hypothetical protein n=1 Tax=Nesterenkonia pannonica TaxID=1548602 RepID=UPI002164D66C|nr:hypothetical protein [Nesterenkonia pannonica]